MTNQRDLLLEFMDTVTLKGRPREIDVIKTQFIDSDRPGKRTLEVTFDATHAGLLTSKGAFYLPTEMEKGAVTLLKEYPKPVLKNHNDADDPIGRIKSVKYIDTSRPVVEKYPFIMPILNSKTHKSKKIEIARRIVSEIISQDSDYKGLGHLQITTEINDEDAINKFLDGRYQTPSTYFRPNKAAHCGLCGQNLLDSENGCNHNFGDSEGGVPFFLVPFGFDYKEISVVNIPADKQARVTDVRLKDSEVDFTPILTDKDSGKKTMFAIYADSLVEIKDLNTGETMDKVEIVEREITEETPVVEEKVEETKEETKDGLQEEGQKEVVKEDAIQDGETHTLPNLGKIDEKLSDETWIKETFGDAENIYFAGPNKSFPTDSLEQVTRGLEVLNKFEDSEAKKMIAEALELRVKTLESLTSDKEEIITKDYMDADEVILKNINSMIDTLAESYPGDDEEYSGSTEGDDFGDAEDVHDKPGGSNAGKYKKGPFCGPSGGAPKGTYPVNTRKRAKAALSLARHAPNPSGIKACVHRHWPDLGDSKDSESVTCNTCKDKDTKINILQAQLDSERAFNKLFMDNQVKVVAPKVENKTEKEEFKDSDIISAPQTQDPTLTRTSEVTDNIDKEEEKPTVDPRVLYKDIYERYQGFKILGQPNKAKDYLRQAKLKGFLPADVNF